MVSSPTRQRHSLLISPQPMTRTTALQQSSNTQDDYDVSVPYDAAARLAYEKSDKKQDYETFEKEYLEQAIALVKSKQQSSSLSFGAETY